MSGVGDSVCIWGAVFSRVRVSGALTKVTWEPRPEVRG